MGYADKLRINDSESALWKSSPKKVLLIADTVSKIFLLSRVSVGFKLFSGICL